MGIIRRTVKKSADATVVSTTYSTPAPGRWQIVTTREDGSTYSLGGYVSDWNATDDALRYVDAIAAGLRADGFNAEVTVTRETVERRTEATR